MLLRGYGVLDDPKMPIIGEGDAQPNDTYVEQLVSGAQAIVDEVVRRGVGDRDERPIAKRLFEGEEITEEVFELHADTIFAQAENRLHAQKAVLAWLLG